MYTIANFLSKVSFFRPSNIYLFEPWQIHSLYHGKFQFFNHDKFIAHGRFILQYMAILLFCNLENDNFYILGRLQIYCNQLTMAIFFRPRQFFVLYTPNHGKFVFVHTKPCQFWFGPQQIYCLHHGRFSFQPWQLFFRP